jgi:hypothetical protein
MTTATLFLLLALAPPGAGAAPHLDRGQKL